MKNPEAYLKAFINTVQYLSIMPMDVDIYKEAAGIITRFFNSDFVIFVLKGSTEHPKWQSSYEDTSLCENIINMTQETIRQTFDSGFLATELLRFADDTHYSLGFLPVMAKHQTTAVMIVGYKTHLPITKDTLNVYLALSVIIGSEVEKRAYTESILKSKQFVETVLNSIVTDAISIIDIKDYRITAVNKFFTDEVCLSEPDIIGKTCYQVTHHLTEPCKGPDHRCPLQDVIISGKASIYEHIHYKSDGSKMYVEVCASPIKDERGNITHIVHVSRDITEKKNLQEQLIQAQKMESLGLMAGGIAHDFNNILTVIAGYAGLLSARTKHDPTMHGYVEQILTASEKASNLTRSLLAFSRKQIINPSIISINQVIEGIAKLLKRLVPADIQIDLRLCPDEQPVFADAHQIEQIIINLVVNAKDAMPKGGNISIHTEKISIKQLQGYNIEPGNYMLISVSDTGEGMDEGVIKHIFEPFFTTKEAGKGTGLGLATVYGIVKQHSGHINVYSEKGIGSTFKIYLPVAQDKDETTTNTTKPLDKAALRGKETILIGDDEELVRGLLKESLVDYGYTVLEAADGDEAIARFAEYPEEIQLLILDLIMPKRNGREVYEAIKAIKPDIKVIFISGYPQDILTAKDLYEEGFEFIPKPLDTQKLIQRIRKVLDVSLYEIIKL